MVILILVLDLDKDKNGGRHKTRTRSATTLNCRTRYAWKVLNPDTLGAQKTWDSVRTRYFLFSKFDVQSCNEGFTYRLKSPRSTTWKYANYLFLISVVFCFQIASLPGRFDQIDHLQRPESPNIRSISPISILRDSRPVSPLVCNSNHSSPATTPFPSPENHLPSTPPIRLEDFSPLKSEDDTGIHSGSSETDHEVRGRGWGGGGQCHEWCR